MNYASWETMRHNKPETMSDDKVSGLFVIRILG